MAAENRPPTYQLSRWLFLRSLGVVYAVAFGSLWPQVHGLVGSRGMLPVTEFLTLVRQRYPGTYWLKAPTLCWLMPGDTGLTVLCVAGLVLSALLIVGIAPIPVLVGLWATYLSLMVAGQDFLSFQWDTLLLETGFCAMFIAPLLLVPRPSLEHAPPPAGRWLLWLLLMKLMFLSGVTKLLSGDPTWRNLTALDFHYQTQPLPNVVSWYAHHLPGWFQQLSIVLMFAIEIVVPFLLLVPGRARRIACGLLVFLQLLIAATGNYGFFNLVAIVLCLSLLDDAVLLRWLPRRYRERADAWSLSRPRARRRDFAVLVPVCWIAMLSGVVTLEGMIRSQGAVPIGVMLTLDSLDRRVVQPVRRRVLSHVEGFHTINSYGLFRTMTTARPEIVLEASRDGRQWVEYRFRYKARNVDAPPTWSQPHMPRLDWQLWFAALHPPSHEYWLGQLGTRLLEGSPEVTGLLGPPPFGRDPPRYIRIVRYRYQFTTPDEKRRTGAWWKRDMREIVGVMRSE